MHVSENDQALMEAPARLAPTRADVWEDVSRNDRPSWYLDPLVAQQKRRLNAELVTSKDLTGVRRALKTDAFEEAFGDDSPLPDLLSLSETWIVMDGAAGIVERAEARRISGAVRYLTADIRHLPVRTAGLDMLFSNSTLDHFESAAEFDDAVRELARVLRPGGRLVFTTDNPLNPGYWVLRWLCDTRLAPFPLGYTPGPARLRKLLEQSGFDVLETGVMIHNPRGLSTILFLILRRMLGTRANAPIQAALSLFEWFGRLPTRLLTGCYLTVYATRR